jgi:putative metalloenzyme radical SAM/SPASM domain maturase
MCVKHSGMEHAPDGDMSPETFEALKPAFPHLQALILNGVGEPLLHPRLDRFIRSARQAMPEGSWVGFQTNGHLLDKARALSLIDAGLDRIFLSVDSATPDLFKAVRGGGNLGHVERALDALAHAKRECPGSGLEVGAQFVLMQGNMHELPGAVAWLAERGVARLVVSHVLPYGEAMADQTVFGANAESSVRFHEQWAARAREEGIDLGRYFEVLWKYNKTPDESRIVRFVSAMSARAREEGVPFHVGNLLGGENLEEAEAVLGKARAVAWESGLTLVLPPLRPLPDRPCLAVEQGGAFVAWDGRVSPCHFLWRSSDCYFYGSKKRVLPRYFGQLPKDSIMDIWNGPAYREFRAAVVRRGYPHCPGCNVYPCVDIETTGFEFDCYGETIPCGDCLWSMGLLQCMGQERAAG